MTREQLESIGFKYDSDAPQSYSISNGVDVHFSGFDEWLESFETPKDLILHIMCTFKKKYLKEGAENKLSEIRSILNVKSR